MDQFNDLYDTEADLMDSFEEDLGSEEGLDRFTSEDAEVFENVNQRREQVESIMDLNQSITDQADYLADYDGEELNQEEVQALADNLHNFTDQVEAYTDQYQSSLDNQETFFQNIGSDDVSGEEFIQGLEDIEAEDQDLKNQASELNADFDQILDQIDDFAQSVSQAEASQEGENEWKVKWRASYPS